jgi:hypothetical protein
VGNLHELFFFICLHVRPEDIGEEKRINEREEEAIGAQSRMHMAVRWRGIIVGHQFCIEELV